MNTLVRISPNMFFLDSLAFGSFDRDVVFGMFRLVDEGFSEAFGTEPYSSADCVISYNQAFDFPMCCQEGGYHHIYLRCSDDYWCQWMFQFAHEYCHHLIAGAMTGEITGLAWFEESVCELSSMYHLQSLVWHCESDSRERLSRYAPAARSYLAERLDAGEPGREASSPGFLNRWYPSLQEPKYHRGLYRAIAARMFPLFAKNPCLWRIILHFGDMRQWRSLEALFDHLEREAGLDCLTSLSELRDLLLS